MGVGIRWQKFFITFLDIHCVRYSALSVGISGINSFDFNVLRKRIASIQQTDPRHIQGIEKRCWMHRGASIIEKNAEIVRWMLVCIVVHVIQMCRICSTPIPMTYTTAANVQCIPAMVDTIIHHGIYRRMMNVL